MASNIPDLKLEDVMLVWRNFGGKETAMNREGDRNFCVFLDPETVPVLQNDGWNVKFTRPSEDGDDGRPYLQVSLGYKVRPPMIWMISSRGRSGIMQDMVELLDDVDIRTADIIIHPYEWEVAGRRGVRAYVKTLYIVVEENELDLKYADVPEAKL